MKIFAAAVITAQALLLLALLTPAAALAASFQTFQPADLVLGRANFTDSTAPLDPPSTTSMNSPNNVAVDPITRKVYVAESDNNRVLRYASAAALANGAPADAVFGQPNFASKSSNQGGTATAQTLSYPNGVFADSAGRLWVSEGSNNRVLMFKNAATLGSNAPADLVLGQSNFTTATNGTTAATMKNPARCFLDQNNRLWIADQSNHRVLRFDNAPLLPNGSSASGVLGQPDFTTGTAGTSATTMSTPVAVAVDAAGRLWVADGLNHRVLRFDGALANGAAASGVLGQNGFNTGATGITATQFNTPISVTTDAAGNLWVADAANNRVVRFSNAANLPAGSPADLVLGQPDFATTISATTARQFSLPSSVFSDATGALWVSDNANHRVLRFNPIATPPPVPAPAAPTVQVAGKKTLTTTKAKLTLRGTAANAATVEVQVGPDKFKSARGTTKWSFPASLKPGKNKILVRAVGPTGVPSRPLKITVIRD